MMIRTESTPGNKENTVNQANLHTQTSKVSQKKSQTQMKENKPQEEASLDQSKGEQGKDPKLRQSGSREPEAGYQKKFKNILVNNFMKPDTADEPPMQKDFFKKFGLELSQNEDEEDFLKANSSKLNTDKNSKAEEKKDLELREKSSERKEQLGEPVNTDSEKNFQPDKEQVKVSSQVNPSKNKIFEEDDGVDSEDEMVEHKSGFSGNLHFHEDQTPNGENAYLKEANLNLMQLGIGMQDRDHTEDDEELGLVAEPEAVDVSVCTENLEEFDHDESPNEVMDSDEEHDEDDEDDF